MSSNESLEILRDSWINDGLKVRESIETPSGEYTGCVLATIEGPALDYIKDTRNGRGYEEELWDSVVNGEYVRELFNTKNFLGEPDHPMQWENRSDIHYPYVSHAIRELYKKPELGCYWVVIDILDTPNGRILKTLLDYGTKLGVSSRGSGRTITKNGRVIVDKNTYRFITIDIVPMPGNASARMNATNESINLSSDMIDRLSEQVDMMISLEDSDMLESTKLILNQLEDAGCSLIIEKIDGYLKDSSEGSISETNTNSNLSVDLVEAYAIISKLKSEISSKDLVIEELAEKVESMSKEQNTSSVLEEKLERASQMAKSSMVNESKLRIQVNEFKDKISELTESLKSTTDELETTNMRNSNLRSKLSELKKELVESKSQVYDEISSLQESLSISDKNLESVTDQLNSVIDQRNSYSRCYFELRCKNLGINSKLLESKIGDISKYDVEQLNEYISDYFKSSGSRDFGTSNIIIPGSVKAKYSQASNKKVKVLDESISDSHLSGITESARMLRDY